MAVEFELKYRCDGQTLALLRAHVPGQECHFAMQTTYYDTADGALSARRYTLRRRQENENSVCTLKIPADGGARGEFEVVCGSIEEAIPMLCKLSGVGLTELTAGGVVPVCGAEFTRIAKTFDWNGAVIELALDQGVLTGGGREEPLAEAELELKEGSREAVEAYGAFLSAAYGLEPESRSKFRRALDLRRNDRV